MMAEKIPLAMKGEDLDDDEGYTIDARGARSDMLDPSFAAWRGGVKMAAAYFLRYGNNNDDEDCDDDDDGDEDCIVYDKEALAFWVTKEEYDEVGPIVAMTTAEEGGKCDYGCFALLPLKAGWCEVDVDSTAPESAVYKSYYANPATGESTWKRPI
tara:strand:- start:81 stop:548 length:468 start_codon:yes stop_codon:yes gene_type:complete